jgi:1-acyl-sn-glycerol-3-phosphate acyltransferase
MLDTRTRWIRRIARVLGRFLLRWLTRTTITGQEYLDTPGPVIFAGNHASTFDPMFLITVLPPDTTFVGPGDFRLLWPGNWVINLVGLIPMKRGSVDREGFKRMLAVLKNGGRLAIFPDGGTWEKRIDDVKPGAAYLSEATGAQIVPMAFAGTYRVWDKIVRLQRPHISVTIGPPLPPVQVSGDRKRRQDELQAAAVDFMWHLYRMLPPEEQARYDRIARQRFTGILTFRPNTLTPPDVTFDALAELVSKPNLFSPLYRNARLPVRPFVQHGRFVHPHDMRVAADALLRAFAEGDYAGYLEYRLGETKAREVRAALHAVRDAMDGAEAAGAQVAFTPVVTEVKT